MENDELNKKNENWILENNEEALKVQEEISNLIATDNIITFAVQDRELENLENKETENPENKETENPEIKSWAEKYKNVDFVGTAGQLLKALIEIGLEKSNKFLKKAKEKTNAGIYKTMVNIEKGQKKSQEVIKEVKETAGNIKDAVVEAPSNARTWFVGKKTDLDRVLKSKSKEWKEKGKEKLSNALSTTARFASAMGTTAISIGSAIVNAPDNTKKLAKKSAQAVVLTGAKGLRAALNKAAEAASKGVKSLDQKIEMKKEEMQNGNKNKDDEGR